MHSIDLLAYIDPGIGSMALQVVVASLLAAGYAFRRALLWPCRVFRRQKGDGMGEH